MSSDNTSKLFQAIENGDLDLVRQQIEANPACICLRDEDGNLPIHQAACSSIDTKILEYLISQGSDVNAENALGETPLHLASGRNAIVRQYDSDEQMLAMMKWSDRNRNGRAGIFKNMAVIFRRIWDATILQCRLWKIRVMGVGRIHPEELFPSEPDSLRILALLIDKGAVINARNHDGRTALHEAVEENHLWRDIQYLIQRGANVNEQDIQGRTPLHIAASRSCSRDVQIILDAGASLRSLDQNGKTPYDLFTEESRRWDRSYCRLDKAKLKKLLKDRRF